MIKCGQESELQSIPKVLYGVEDGHLHICNWYETQNTSCFFFFVFFIYWHFYYFDSLCPILYSVIEIFSFDRSYKVHIYLYNKCAVQCFSTCISVCEPLEGARHITFDGRRELFFCIANLTTCLGELLTAVAWPNKSHYPGQQCDYWPAVTPHF